LLEVKVNIASMVRVEWLEEFFPDHLRRERVTHYDPSRRRVVSSKRLWYHDLLLREDLGASPDPDEAGPVLAAALASEARELFRANSRAARWLARFEFLKQTVPECGWPDFSDDVFALLLEQICHGKLAREEVEAVDFVPFLQNRLTPAQTRELSASAPESLIVPSGRRIPLTYEPGRTPGLAVRLQELFGWTETPRIARGRVPVLLQILGPNHRPVQVTSDLHSFWSTTYHQVRKDLRARYPKHAWPEDPFHARPPPR
jgi:ATP-dependent helicase HrpB